MDEARLARCGAPRLTVDVPGYSHLAGEADLTMGSVYQTLPQSCRSTISFEASNILWNIGCLPTRFI